MAWPPLTGASCHGRPGRTGPQSPSLSPQAAESARAGPGAALARPRPLRGHRGGRCGGGGGHALGHRLAEGAPGAGAAVRRPQRHPARGDARAPGRADCLDDVDGAAAGCADDAGGGGRQRRFGRLELHAQAAATQVRLPESGGRRRPAVFQAAADRGAEGQRAGADPRHHRRAVPEVARRRLHRPARHEPACRGGSRRHHGARRHRDAGAGAGRFRDRRRAAAAQAACRPPEDEPPGGQAGAQGGRGQPGGQGQAEGQDARGLARSRRPTWW